MAENIYLTICSETFGWIYFFAWSCSFWAQIYLNWKRKSVRGMSFDFVLYNFTGFLAYLIYCLIYYLEERRRHLTETVMFNDLAFSGHALFVTCLTIIQIFGYEREDQALSKVAVQLVTVLWVIAIYNLILSSLGCIPWWDKSGFSSTIYLGYVKSVVSIVKYMPQAWMNFQHKTTKGFSMENVMLDFTGGIFSLSQQVIDSVNKNDWSIIFGNIPKLILALQSICFDILFFFQHFCLYGAEKDRPIPGEETRTWIRKDRFKISGDGTVVRPVQSARTPKTGEAGELGEPLLTGDIDRMIGKKNYSCI